MPRGRPTNHDKKIALLIAQLRRALVSREQARVEGQVALHVDALVQGLRDGHAAAAATGAAPAKPAAAPAARSGKGNRRPRSAASRKAQSLKMKKGVPGRRGGRVGSG